MESTSEITSPANDSYSFMFKAFTEKVRTMKALMAFRGDGNGF